MEPEAEARPATGTDFSGKITPSISTVGLNGHPYLPRRSLRRPEGEGIRALASAGGLPSAFRAGTPDPGIVQLLRAERPVEIFEAELWGGGQGDEADLISLAGTACTQSHVPLPPVPQGAVTLIRANLAAFSRTWTALPQGAEVKLD